MRKKEKINQREFKKIAAYFLLLFIFLGSSFIFFGGCGQSPSSPSSPPPQAQNGGFIPTPLSFNENSIKADLNSDWIQATPQNFTVIPLTGAGANDTTTSYTWTVSVTDPFATVTPGVNIIFPTPTGSQQFTIVLNSVQNYDTGDNITVSASSVYGIIGLNTTSPNLWFQVLGTSEAIQGQSGDSGQVSASTIFPNNTVCTYAETSLDEEYVALPYAHGPAWGDNYGQEVVVWRQGVSVTAPQWDCGPWYCASERTSPPPAQTPYSPAGDNYWNLGQPPLAASLAPGVLNKSGIDLSGACDSALNETAGVFSGIVMWRFVPATQLMTPCPSLTPTFTPTTCDASDCTNGCPGAPTCTFTFTPTFTDTPTCDYSDCNNHCSGYPTCTFTFTPTPTDTCDPSSCDPNCLDCLDYPTCPDCN